MLLVIVNTTQVVSARVWGFILRAVPTVLPLDTQKVTGPNKEFTVENGKGPKKVYCWMEDRDGGGWTLGMKNWYGQHHGT